MFWIIGACVCVHRDIQMCDHGSTCYTHKHAAVEEMETLDPCHGDSYYDR